MMHLPPPLLLLLLALHHPCRFLQQNLLTHLAPGCLAAQPLLDTLNVSGNQLTGLDGLAGCTQLRTLIATDNQLAGAASLAALAQCTELESIDLQNNQLEGGEDVLAVLASLPLLKCLYIKGNPLVSAMRNYRKATIAALPGLTYLDDRPVFEMELLCAEAWWVLG
jgi:dynein assembly factor 1